MPSDLPKPPSPRLRAALEANIRLLAVADRLKEHWNLHARRVGLSGVQVKLLLSLAADEVVTMRELAKRLRYDASNLTGLVDRLERDELIERRPHHSDRRITEVRLTAHGLRVRDDFWTALNAQGPLDPLTKTQLERLDETLRTVLGSVPEAS
jgi:DNA-binding MarR family transcriptional regulator